MIDIDETINKLRQITNLKFRRKGNDSDIRRILEKHCDKYHISPVFIGEF